MDESLRSRADARLDQALATQPLADPRDLFRDRLRRLRAEDPPAFSRALDYFERTLVPRVAADAEPLAEWIEYGRFLAELSGRGRLVGVDASGRGRPFTPPPAAELVLFLPDDPAVPVLPVARPRELSDAQQAAWDLLVAAGRER
ncbi:MAG TPA: hypothetical protein VFQ38_22945 [Longimicrobiales bacterium]|nr:hypothetical protein [Longimicrobiales bacterium]